MAGAQNEGMFGGLFARRMSAMNFAVIFKPTLLYLLSALIVSSISTASPLLCQDLAKSDELRPQTQDINQDLRALYFKEIYSHTIDQIQALNFEALVKINSSIPEKSATRLSEASEKMLDQLYQTIMTHKVVSPLIAKYDQPHVSVGYCFGRATYAHLKL
jgi:hypothetical protein